jgi:hypothetical protein
MKALWTALSIIALANLIAIVVLVAWLKTSDRLDSARVHEVRQLFSRTVSQVKAEEEASNAAAERKSKDAAEEAKKGGSPVSASDKLELRLERSKADDVRLEAAKRDLEILRDTIARERSRLDEDRKEFEQTKVAWDKERQAQIAGQQSEQFKKTLATLEALKPEKAKSTLQELLAKNQKDQVVAYLDAMQERTRTKIIDEFVKGDPKLAADLLERLRTRGQVAPAPRAASQ